MTISVTNGLALCIVLTASLTFGYTTYHSKTTSLRFAAIIHRHGDRSPNYQYPNDPHKDYNWPGGAGALSSKGVLQLYNLGAHLRLRYHLLLPSNGMYTKESMFIMSSAIERCLMSAQSLLAGFLPPPKNQNKLPLLWQPVAINSIPRDRDTILAQQAACPKYDKIFEQMYSNPSGELKDFIQQNAAVFAYLTKHTGSNITDIHQVERLHDLLLVQEQNGLALPEWTKKVYPEKMLEIAKRNIALLTETPFMKRVKGGPLITEIVDTMLKKKSDTLQPNRSLVFYSAHDITLLSVMRALALNNQTSNMPDYGATFTMELHQNDVFKDNFEIKIWYYTNTEELIPKELSIPNCNSPCSLTKFVDSIQHVIVRDYNKICIDH